MVSFRTFKKQNLSNAIAFLFFILISSIAVIFYEPWRDEADTWLVGQDMSLEQLFWHLRDVGHPGLWYALVMPFAKAGLPYITQNIIHLGIAFAAVYVFLFRSPLPAALKIVFIFSVYMSFEYTVTARNYTPAILLLFLIASLYPQRVQKPLTYCFLIALLFQTNVIIIGAAVLFAGEFILASLAQKKVFQKRYLASILLLIAGVCLLPLQLHSSEREVLNLTMFLPLAFLGVLRDGFFGIENILLPAFFYHYLSPFTALAGIILSGIVLHLLSTSKPLFLFFSLASAWVLFVATFVYTTSMRHHAFILIFMMLCLWLSYYLPKEKTLAEPSRRNLINLLSLVLLFNAILSGIKHYQNISNQTSAAKSTALFLAREEYLDYAIVGYKAPFAEAVLPYLREYVPGKKIWYPYIQNYGSYIDFDKNYYTKGEHDPWGGMADATVIKLAFHHFGPEEKLLFLFSRPIERPEAYHLRKIFESRGKWTESFWIYVPFP